MLLRAGEIYPQARPAHERSMRDTALMPLGAALPATDVSDALARRLRKETQGEVLFDAGSRGRYATDASIYQIMPVGVLVPEDERDVTTALAIARDLKVPVLPRGGGTSQCGQTTGAALVIDDSKYLRKVLDVDVAARTATVEPGLVLDHLNAQLKPHGLWYPVDVSTSAQATLGGMAGNNSCGSRSIAYGNMVHNVLGIERVAVRRLADATSARSRRSARSEAAIAAYVQGLAVARRAEIAEHWPKVLRRVAGYNLDIFDPQSEKPYTADGSVNLAHLLVGAEGTLAFTKSLTLQLSPLPRDKVLGVVNFPTFHAAMDAPQHLVKLGPTAVELVDRTMIELSLANPAFRPSIEAALIGRPEAILLVEFAGDDRAALLAKLKDLVALMGDLGLPGSVVEMPDPAIAEEPVGSPQGGSQHHDEPEGRRQAGQLHRGLRGAARAPGRLHRRADRGVRAPRHARHLVRARVGRHAARAPDPRHAHAVAPRRCARSPRRRRCWCASTRARSAASTATACAAANGSHGSSGRPSTTRSGRSSEARSDRPLQPRQDRRSAADGRRLAVPLPAGQRTEALSDDPAEDGARLVGLGRAERPGHRADDRPRAPAATTPAASRRPSRCATTTATVASSTPARCVRAIA